MTLPMVTTDKPTRRLPALSSSVEPLPEWAEALVPDSVVAASRSHAAALEVLHGLRQAHRDACAAAAGADELDRQAAAEAVMTGRNVPPAVAPTASAAVQDAVRAIGAGEEAARETQHQLMVGLAEHRKAINAAIAAEVAAIAAAAEPVVAEIEATILRRVQLANLAGVLEHVEPMARAQWFTLPPFKSTPADIASLLETVKQAMTGSRTR